MEHGHLHSSFIGPIKQPEKRTDLGQNEVNCTNTATGLMPVTVIKPIQSTYSFTPEICHRHITAHWVHSVGYSLYVLVKVYRCDFLVIYAGVHRQRLFYFVNIKCKSVYHFKLSASNRNICRWTYLYRTYAFDCLNQMIPIRMQFKQTVKTKTERLEMIQ